MDRALILGFGLWRGLMLDRLPVLRQPAPHPGHQLHPTDRGIDHADLQDRERVVPSWNAPATCLDRARWRQVAIALLWHCRVERRWLIAPRNCRPSRRSRHAPNRPEQGPILDQSPTLARKPVAPLLSPPPNAAGDTTTSRASRNPERRARPPVPARCGG